MAEETAVENIKELEDGSVRIGSTETEETSEEQIEQQAHEDEQNDVASDAPDEEREALRAERRQERRLKKDFQKKREVSLQHRVQTLQRANEEYARRIAALENSTSGFKLAGIDKQIEDQQLRINYMQRQLQDAIVRQDAVSQARVIDELTDEKARLKEIQAYKQQQIQSSKKPNNVPTPSDIEKVKLANAWASKNSWYDHQGRDADSRIARVIDEDLAKDGWDPADPEYWEELDARLAERLPHKYTKNRRQVVQSSRDEYATDSPRRAQNSYHLSKERKEALIQAGVWDDPKERQKYIDRYRDYDKAQRNR